MVFKTILFRMVDNFVLKSLLPVFKTIKTTKMRTAISLTSFKSSINRYQEIDEEEIIQNALSMDLSGSSAGTMSDGVLTDQSSLSSMAM